MASTRGAKAGSWIATGMDGDVIAIDHDPLAASPDELRAMPVALTVVGGRVTHSALS